ncbi:Exopolyphosphatase [Vermiconidia calcicola]|uniref:Exopolyphosphatase n=1 Tax=Vermiconidia calcicola TaxID=1690605 RepID=A0ACC3MWQ7_9PEZI|nr:Exopolyphosphatase [Vermiconidia calcicola]
MSRMTISAFLSKAKQSLSQSLKSKGEHPASFVIGNESADLDSITCALVYVYIHSSTPEARKAEKCMIPVSNIPSSELRLRPELTALLKHAGLKPTDLVTLDDLGKIQDVLPPNTTDWTLVDHNVLQGTLGEHYSDRIVGVIDHHDDEGKVSKDAKPRIIEKTGSCNSHVVNYCRESWDSISSMASTTGAAHGQGDGALDDAAYTSTWDAQVATLALGSILIDTINMEAEHKVTDHDRKAVKYLEAKINASAKLGPKYDRNAFFAEISDAKSDLSDVNLEEILRKDYKQWDDGGLALGISSVVQPIEYLLTNKLDSLANFVPALLNYAKGRKLDLFAVMTAHNASDTFERQLLLLTVEEGKAVEVAEKFANENSKELQLEESDVEIDGSKAVWMKTWEQKDLAASRKKVAPLLREAMK